MKYTHVVIVTIVVALGFFLAVARPANADQEPDEKDKQEGLSLEAGRKIRLSTDEGTWISLDVSPDGQQIAFDLMGDLYRLPIGGGKAERITAGLAYDTHPKFSPDGNSLAFTSDRDGNENIWILDLATDETSQVTKHKTDYFQSAEWTPDGQYLVVAHGRSNLKLHLYHRDGGGGAPLIKEPETLKTTEPAFGADDRYIWFSQRTADWQYNAQLPQYQLASFDRETGEIDVHTNRYGSAFAPTLSPDGRWLVYGSRHDEKTGLVKRDLETGDESWLAYPVQRDEQESRARLGVYPAMSFTPDSRYLICTYDGKLWKLPIAGGSATPIPFEVDVELDFGPDVRFDFPISDDATMTVKQIRDATLSPDGKRLAFTALDRLYVMDYPDGRPQRMTRAEHTEAMPTWSPDGSAVAYVTWEGSTGSVYRVPASGGKPRRLTREPGVFFAPAWDPNTGRIAFLYGKANAYRRSTGPGAFGAAEFIGWVAPDGGAVQQVERAHGRGNVHFVNGDERIYLYHGRRGLLSIRWDGTDEKEHLKVTGITTYPALAYDQCLFQQSDEEPKPEPSRPAAVTLSPVGGKAMALINNDVYVVTVPRIGGEVPTIALAKPEAAAFPARKLTEIGGQFPRWTADGERVHWSIANAFFDYDLAAAKQFEAELKARKKAEAEAEADDTEAMLEGHEGHEGHEGDEGDESEGDDEEDDDAKKEDEERYQATEMRVTVTVDRDIPQGQVLLQGARLITMNGDEIIENGDLLIENNRIKALGPGGQVQVGRKAKTIDVRGKTIVPGFVDTHAHLRPAFTLHKAGAWAYMANLAYGVTTTRDPQTGSTDVLTYGDMVDAGSIIGPRIYSTGPGVGFWAYRIESLEHAKRVLKQYSEYYDTKTIKMYITGNRQHRQWIIEAAKEQGLMPTTEGALDFKMNMTQLVDGYPGHEHNLPIYPIYADVVQLVAEAGMAYTPTMLVAYGGPWAENYFYSTEDVQSDTKLRHFTPKLDIDRKSRRRPGWFLEEEHIFARHAEFVRDVVEAGGIVGVGSHGQLQGLGYHWELWAMQSGGMTEHDALKTATLLGARAIGLSTDLGSLESGKLADLVVLDGNPLIDIRQTNSVAFVMKNGRLYDGDTLDEVHPRKRAAPDFSWRIEGPTDLPGALAN